MVSVFFYSCLIIVLTAPFALFILKENKTNTYSYSRSIIFGIIIISFISILLNFFFPLNIFINTLLPILSCLLIIKNKKKFINLNFLKFVILQGLIITILILESNVYRPDAGLYHLPFIGILNSEKIIFGLTNLHSRYALISVQQYFSAVNNNFIFQNNGIVFAQALIAIAVIFNFFSLLNSYIKKKEYNFHFFYLFFIIIYIAYKMNRYSEYGNDAPAHFLVFFLISEILLIKNKFNQNEYINHLILSLFIILNKLTLIFIVFINIINLNKVNFKSLLTDKKFFFCNIFLVIWITKNLISSGCIFYPIKFTCYEKLSWVNIEHIQKVSDSAEAWTKGWSNKKSDVDLSQNEFNKNFNWIKPWSDVHLKLIIKILLPYLIFCSLLIITFKIKYKNKISFKLPREYLYYFLILIVCSAIWFLKSPLYRYGYSFLICTIAFTLAYFCCKIDFKNENKIKLFNLVLILSLTVFIGKNIMRIYKTDNNYNNYPWPKYFSMSEENVLVDFKENKIGDIIILTPLNGYCMYIKKICSHYDVKNELEIKKINGYNILLK